MKYRFNENNNITGYIKELLNEFNLPIYRVANETKNLVDGEIYIVDNTIAKYSSKTGKFSTISPFEYGKRILNATTNLKMNSSIYDTYTHEYLGRFLRFIRDYKKLNLMPLYNCFSCNNNSSFTLVYTGLPIELNTEDIHYDYYLVPVIYGQEYTIAIDSPMSYEMCTLIYTNDELLDVSKKLINLSYKKVNGSLFADPYIYKTPELPDEKYIGYEKCLKLLLKLPKRISSSIVILEGNYLNGSSVCGGILTPEYIINEENLMDRNSFTITPPTKLSLLRINDGNSYPFADRLVEYLLYNAITPIDEIDDNIKRVQDIIYEHQTFRGIYGVWDSNLKKQIYKKCNTTIKNNVAKIYKINNDGSTELIKNYNFKKFKDLNDDLLYLVDKDVEFLLESR